MKQQTEPYWLTAVKAVAKVLFFLFLYYAIQVAYMVIYTLVLFMMPDITTPEILNARLRQDSMMISLVSGLLTLAVFFLIPLVRRRAPLDFFSIRKIPPWTVPMMILFGITASYSLNAILNAIPIPKEILHQYSQSMEPMFTKTDAVTLLSVVVVAPILEELLFRAIPIRQFSRILPRWVAVILSSLLFGVAHGDIIQSCYATALGLLLGLIYVRYGSVLPSILFHIGFNAAAYLLELFPAHLFGIICAFALLFFTALFVLFFVDTYYVKRRASECAPHAMTEEEAIAAAVASGEGFLEED